jgi:hypothetical protein
MDRWSRMLAAFPNRKTGLHPRLREGMLFLEMLILLGRISEPENRDSTFPGNAL